MNPVLGACAIPGRCVASAGSTNLRNATDASFYTGVAIAVTVAGLVASAGYHSII